MYIYIYIYIYIVTFTNKKNKKTYKVIIYIYIFCLKLRSFFEIKFTDHDICDHGLRKEIKMLVKLFYFFYLGLSAVYIHVVISLNCTLFAN